MNKSHPSPRCSVCGGNMTRVKVVSTRLEDLVRYRCTCGHCADVKEEPGSQPKDDTLVLEGFHEIP